MLAQVCDELGPVELFFGADIAVFDGQIDSFCHEADYMTRAKFCDLNIVRL